MIETKEQWDRMVKSSHDDYLETCAAYDETYRIWEKTGSKTAKKNLDRQLDRMNSTLLFERGFLHPDGTMVSWEERDEPLLKRRAQDIAMVMDKLADEEMRKKLKA